MSKIKSFFKKYIPIPSRIFFVILIIAIIVHILAINIKSFADFYILHIGSVVRQILAFITGFFPFSIAETVIIMLPFLIFFLIFNGIRQIKKSSVSGYRYIVSLLSVVSILYSTFVLGFGTGYYTSTIEENLGLNRQDVSVEQLVNTAEILEEKMASVLDQITFKSSGSSVNPNTLDETVDKLNDAYQKVAEQYDFIPSMRSRVKYIALSEPMTYTHISGVYTYYTGESNININFPDYTIAYTAAHEMSHQRGIAREDEANFMAFIVCINSDDPYIQYCGYMNVYEYVISALYSADKTQYWDLISDCDVRIKGEINAYNSFFEKYEENTVATVSSAVNNAYLQSQGQTQGVKSYGRVVDLAVAYYESENG